MKKKFTLIIKKASKETKGAGGKFFESVGGKSVRPFQ